MIHSIRISTVCLLALSIAAFATGLVPIARWDTVPYQRIDASHPLNVAVVAFSKAGIHHVEFTVSAPGQNDIVMSASEMTLNPQTNVYEYWAQLDVSQFTDDGQITVNAAVYGNDDGVRDTDVNTEPYTEVGVGFDPLPLTVNKNDTSPLVEIWVSMSGDDENEYGTEQDPLATIGAALEAISYIHQYPELYFPPGVTPSGGVVHLEPGTLEPNVYQPVYPLWNHPYPFPIPSTLEWISIVGDTTNPDNTVIMGGSVPAGYMPGWPFPDTGGVLLSFHGITFQRSLHPDTDFALKFLAGQADAGDGTNGVSLWLNHCRVIGYDRTSQYNSNPIDAFTNFRHLIPRVEGVVIGLADVYITDTEFDNLWMAVDGVQLCRNVRATNLSDDAFHNVGMVVNCIVDDVISAPATNAHADCWQHEYGNSVNRRDDNVIVYGLTGTNLKYQGIFIRPDIGFSWEDEQQECHSSAPVDLPQTQAQGMAFVNVYLKREHSDFNDGASDWQRAVDHLLWWNCTFRSEEGQYQGMTIYPDETYFTNENCAQYTYTYSITNMSVIGCDFARFVGGAPVVDDSGWRYNHFVSVGGDNVTKGDSYTTGDDMLDTHGYPNADSPLLSRVSPVMAPADDTGRLRGDLGDVGAYESRERCGIDYNETPEHGDGSQLAPYQIANVCDLVWMSNNVNTSSGTYYELTADIDASDTANWDDTNPPQDELDGFKPIGVAYNNRFQGHFDGNGHKITGLVINRPDDYPVGLFSCVSNTGHVINLGVVGGSVTGDFDVGGLIGDNDGTVSNCYATCAVISDAGGGLIGYNDGLVSNCYATGAVTGTSLGGGLIGWNDYDAIVSSCYATGPVTGVQFLGGLFGENDGTVSSCHATGDVTGDTGGWGCVGGLAGVNCGPISNSYATGTVSGEDNIGGLIGSSGFGSKAENCYATGGAVTGDTYVGGLIGRAGYGSLAQYCYSTGEVTGNSNIGGLVGGNDGASTWDSYWDTTTSLQGNSAGGTGKTTTQMKQEYTFVNWDFDDVWDIDEGDSYPFLQ